jgi:glutaredoxin
MPKLIGQIAALTLLWGCSALPNSYETQLAEHLTATGAKMYGAYWCPHCAAQKDFFKAGADSLPYVECDPAGLNAQAERCQAEGIEVYPTWIIEGEFYTGAQPLSQLAALSGFKSQDDPDSELAN